MQYQINAWLEKEHPDLTIIDSKNRQVIKAFHGKELEQLIEFGDVMPDELLTCNPKRLNQLVEELLSDIFQASKPINRPSHSSCQVYSDLLGLVAKAKVF